MTQEDIIWRPEEIVELCKQAGFADGVAECMGLWSLHEFARIVAAAEREKYALMVMPLDESLADAIRGKA